MKSLIPAENWEYSLKDLFDGIRTTLTGAKNDAWIFVEGIGNCIPIRSGRAAIVVALKALKLNDGARIGVPLYSCPVVFKAVKEAGHKPAFIDIERDTLCMSAKDLYKKIDQVDAVIAIHMFGNLCDMPGLLIAAKGKPIIEDCAQSLGSKFNGQMAGTMGTIGIFSFRSGKYLSVGEGGALFSKSEEIASILLSMVLSLRKPSRPEELMHVFKTYLRSKLRSRPLWGLIGKKMWQLYNKSVDYTAKTPIVLGKMFDTDMCLTVERLKSLKQIIKSHRKHAEYYSSTLALNGGMLWCEKSGLYHNRYAYPILFPSIQHRDSIAEILRKQKIDTLKPYQDIAEIAFEHYEYQGDCKIAEMLSKRILIIPSHHRLDRRDIEYVSHLINKSWQQLGCCG